MRDSGYERNENDYYVEPSWVVDALLDKEKFTCALWDPSCGGGNIPKRLKLRGYDCHSSDLIDRGSSDFTLDFLRYDSKANREIPDIKKVGIISNPPYAILEAWITHALTLTDEKIVVLARLAFLEGQKRQFFFKDGKLRKVWVSSRRVSMPPGGTDIKAKGGTVAFAWFVFQNCSLTNSSPPVIGWL